jgi:hypothetical protein
MAEVQTFEEASAIIHKRGILPLSSFIPEHPSLESITSKSAWHTGLDSDPWLWRDRFPGEGTAAYGRFLKKKPVLVDAALFPLFRSALKQTRPIEERYRAGEVSKHTVTIYNAIRETPGIDVKALRKAAGLTAKEDKSEFDNALIELQGSADVVISGISERLNELGNKNGWNSTCYTLAEDWMELHQLKPAELLLAEAKKELFARLTESCSAAAFAFLEKTLR